MKASVELLHEVWKYLKHGRAEFQHEAKKTELQAEAAYQNSMTSAVDVARNARKLRTNADFLREVVLGNG